VPFRLTTLRAAGLAASVAIVAAVVLAAVLGGTRGEAASPAAAARTPKCFGAAARNPRTRCSNPRLRHAVRPTPSMAQITPNAPCWWLKREGLAHPCVFGVRQRSAVRNFALIGDSHAAHWRAAMERVAKVKRWRGVSIANSICSFSRAIKRLRPRGRRKCVRWHRHLLRYFRSHPEINTVFQSQITSREGVFPRPGMSEWETEVWGYQRIWRSLPRTVRHIIVIRDTPIAPEGTPGCVMRARKARRRPGRACAIPRRAALVPDPAAVAASRSRSRRVQLINLSRYFCGKRMCYPVVGGALVHKDVTHMTLTFATSLGPFLLRRVNGLMRTWRDR
jgi:hypothetical protein